MCGRSSFTSANRSSSSNSCFVPGSVPLQNPDPYSSSGAVSGGGAHAPHRAVRHEREHGRVDHLGRIEAAEEADVADHPAARDGAEATLDLHYPDVVKDVVCAGAFGNLPARQTVCSQWPCQ
jgi:hypothetical protein